MYTMRLLYALLMFSWQASGKQTQVATFLKDASIYNSAKIPIISSMDQISLNFKTKQDHSYVFHIGAQPSHSESGLQFLLVFLSDRQLSVQIKHDQIVDSTFRIACVSVYSTCADNLWHSLSISRKKYTIKIEIDGAVALEKVVGDVFSQLLSQYIVFGSSIPMVTNDDKGRHDYPNYLQNYRGCFRQIIYTADHLDLDILTQAKSQNHFISKGEIYFDKCSDLFPIEPISFQSEAAYINLKGWHWGQRGRLQFTIRTTETDSLLAFQKSDMSQNNQFDFYAFELRHSYLQFTINTGSGAYSQRVSDVSVSDGANHYVKLWFEDGKVEVQLDAERKLERSDGSYRTLDITGDLFLGGISEDLVSFFPHSIWSGILRQGFVGCLIDISVNDVQYDLALKVRNENISGIATGCMDNSSEKNSCENKPCMDGTCTPGYNRFICDCSRTNYTGKTCSKVATLVKFNGFQSMIITMPHGYQSESEDVTLRFLTTRPNGVLLITKSRISGTPDKVKVYIDNGFVAVLLNFGKGNKVIRTSVNVFDGRWHTFKLRRRQLSLIVSVDDVEVKNNLSGRSKLLSNDIINLGRYRSSKTDMFFTGFMMHFIFNGVNYFEMVRDESLVNIEVTATIGDAELAKEFPITMQSASSYLRLPKIYIYGDFKLEFFVKTRSSNGKILQLYGRSGDYLILEIISGYLSVIFNWGDGHKNRTNEEVRIDDNKWHRVLLVRENSISNAFAFRINGRPKGSDANIALQSGGINFNSFDDLYLGNADKFKIKGKRFPNQIATKKGFTGCIASFYMNQTKAVLKTSVFQNLLSIALASNGVVEGCKEDLLYKVSCTPNTCRSRGRCIQQWMGIRCDCSMTSFAGSNCDEVSKTLKFNDYPAYLIFKLSPSRNTTVDELAFGIQTSVITSTPIILIEGDGKQPDFISVKLLKDKGRSIMVIEYNMGSGTARVMEPSVNIADGYYHSVAFTRNEKVASLQVDELTPKIFNPTGKASIHFNQQRSIFVGKIPSAAFKYKRSVDGSPSESFSGYLSGIYFNRILLGNLLNNASIAGIKLINHSNVNVASKFIPNFKKKTSKTSILSEQEVVRDSDQIQKNNPLIVAKRNCSSSPSSHKLECKSTNSRGLIRPNVSYRFNEVTSTSPFIIPISEQIQTDGSLSKTITNFKTEEVQKAGSINVWLIIGFSMGGTMLLILITCFIYRCCRQDEGSYNVEEDRVFFDPSSKPLKINDSSKDEMELHNNNSVLTNSSFSSTKQKPSRRDKTSDTKEWYV